MAYTPPIRDMQFVLDEIADLQSVTALPAFEEATPDLVGAILEEAGKFASDVLEPLNVKGDQEGAKWTEEGVVTVEGWKEAYEQFVEAGWGTLGFDPEFGGQGMPMTVSTPVQEMWHSSNMSFGLCPMLTQGAVDALMLHGSDELKQTYLHKMVSGEWTGTMNLTEPAAGSNLAAVRTKAEPKGDHYLISGQKIFITYGDHDMTDNIIHLVLARTPDAPEGVKGISLFVVPKFMVNEDGSLGERNDAHCVSIEHKLGIHASPTSVMAFGDNGGAVGYLVGEENKGLMYMFTMMNLARHAVGVEGYAMGEIAYQKAVEYARDRVQGGVMCSGESKGIINHPDVRRMLMSMRSQVEAARALAFVCAAAFDKAHSGADEDKAYNLRRGELLTPLVKGWSTEIGVDIASLGVQVHGGMGFIEETGAAQYLRDVRITPIYEGTTGIQAGDLIGRKCARDGGQGVAELVVEMNSVLADLRAQGAEQNESMVGALAAAIETVESSTAWLLAQNNPALPAAGSFNYLMLMGFAAGGWVMAKGAHAAAAKIAAGEGDQAFYQTKLVTCRYYAEQMMPRIEAYARAMTQGSESAILLNDDQF